MLDEGAAGSQHSWSSFAVHARERMHTWPSRGARLEDGGAMKYANNIMVIVQVDTYRALISDSHVLTYFCQFIRHSYCQHLTGQGGEA